MITEQSAAIEAQIIELRRQHLTWREIGATVGKSHEGARQIYNAALSRYPAEKLGIMRVEEGELIDEARRHLKTLALTATAERNRIEAWRTYILASESKRKLYGVDSPLKREIEIIDSGDAQFRAEIAELEAEARAAERNRV